MILKQRFALAAFFAFCLSAWNPAAASSSPVLLSFDVEVAADEPALRQLNIAVPATYFITGKFSENNNLLVKSLAKAGNTIGSHSSSHPHFNTLDENMITEELSSSKNLLELISGKPVLWFRAPYLEYDLRVMQTLKALGYLGDSSDKDSWTHQEVVYEMPISNFMDASLIASDYDMIEDKKIFVATVRRCAEKDVPRKGKQWTTPRGASPSQNRGEISRCNERVYQICLKAERPVPYF